MRKIMKVRVTTTEKEYIKDASRDAFINHKIYGKDFVVIHEKKEILKLNKPIYIGSADQNYVNQQRMNFFMIF